MRWLLITILTIGLVLLGGSIQYPENRGQEILIVDRSKKLPDNPYQLEYEKMLYPTVRIKAGLSIGSGVVIDGYILTAAHVVGDESAVTVELFYPKNIEIEAEVIITDTIKDLALLRVLCVSVAKATLAPQDYTPYIFAPVYTVGCSLGLSPRPSPGIISVITDRYWEISAPILPGNSGGPVFDARTYEVIGIAVWVHTYRDQLVTTMAGVVPLDQIYEFLMTNDQCLKKSE